ncbi:MAG: threonylcarbamoyl-AMP synthase [Alphaproteobacteria bacterium]|nr:threonylcarbamoyl-AMP synthase [Alphaproteobacteria bacterium]
MPIYAPIKSNLDAAVDVLRSGDLVAFPTETVYGLGADAMSDAAVARVFAIKRRPDFNPLIVHLANPEDAETLAILDDRAELLAAALWPGPLTLVLPRTPDCPVSRLASAGLATIALRAPDHRVARALLTAFGGPLVAPSANISGQLSPTLAKHVERSFGDDVTMILDGGPCRVGLESTVVACFDDAVWLLRPGGIEADAIEDLIGVRLRVPSPADEIRAPGMLQSHYAPNLPLRLNATTVAAGEALLAFGPKPPAGAATVLNLSERGNLQQAAAQLFAMLHELDRPDYDGIAVMPVPNDGLGVAINDRLRRAAAL